MKLFSPFKLIAISLLVLACGTPLVYVLVDKLLWHVTVPVVEEALVVIIEQLEEIEKSVKDPSRLNYTKVQLRKVQASLPTLVKEAEKLRKEAENHRTEARVCETSITRIEKEANRSQKAFEEIQKVAKEAGLPKLTNATDEDKKKRVQIASGRTLSGREVYLQLQTYKQEVLDAGEKIAELKDQISSEWKQADETDKSSREFTRAINEVEKEIKAVERLVKDRERAEKLENTRQFVSNTKNTLRELQKLKIRNEDELDRLEKREEEITHEVDSEELKSELIDPKPPVASITDDDLV